MPIPIDPRKKPSSVKVRVSDGSGLDILWADGHCSHYDFAYLREQCPCAMCDEERAKQYQLSVRGEGAPAVANPLPMFKPRPRARAARAVGQYALQIDFSDGHATGIYSFDYLRTICPCQECARNFRNFSGSDNSGSGGSDHGPAGSGS